MYDIETYTRFSRAVRAAKRNILKTLIDLKENGAEISAYGAPAKGNTLLNYCGIGTDFIDFTVDKNPLKQNTLLPGTRIPVYHPKILRERKPNYIVVLPWNLKNEIIEQLHQVCDWNPKFITLIPNVEICS